ncbi:ABC transporter substrate-binding protein [Leucobacter triazinivorans]|uniref:ABC transporter substrate-binding protein n=1 Tax=Leucobacter triazinivorans TaxID=1784719 RepID=A0A4P6KJB3_9MICO|nr:ABC transporter substrate-binding protein [Leucobacter triazinivorans]QBE50201.1 ABC transporter substrate-binding protein [Leucobacter triazinivorans]
MLNNQRTRPRAAAGAALALSLACVLTSCAAPGAETGGVEQSEEAPGFLAVADESLTGEGALTVQLDYDTSEADGLDPQTAQTARSWMIMGLVYETLVTTDENFEIQPALATSWEQPDDTTYVFTIDTAATFSNGRPLTVDDVVGSLERQMASMSVWSGQMGPVESIEATGDDQVTVTLSSPYAPFLAALANTPAAILPMQEVNDGSVDLTTTMLGTGPYLVSDHRQDESWTFMANPDWRGGDDLAVQTLELQIVDQESTRQAALREGSTGMANFVNIDSLSQLGGNEGLRVVNQTQSDLYYVFVNSQKPDSPLNDQDVRFAINTAIDRQAIADIVFAGETSPTGITPSNLPGACLVDELPSEQATIEDAKAVIEESGAGDAALDLVVYTSEPVMAQIAQLVQQQLAEIGVTVEIEQFDTATYNERVFTAQPGEFDLSIGWFAGYTDPSMVTKWWNPEQAFFNVGFTGVHEDLNALIAEGASESDPSARAEVLTELCASADEYSEIVPLVHRPSIIGFDTAAVSPTIQSNEGYGDILRNIVDYRIAGE